MNMRVLIILMILAVNFSGFSTAAHAFSDAFCDSATGKQVESGIKCPDHQLTSAAETGALDDVGAKAQCLDCIHCCSGHVLSMTLSSAALVVVMQSVKYPVMTHRIADGHVLSLLRPPQIAA
jgi:hypothetical protein